MKFLERLLTNNLTKIPLLYINFNYQYYKKHGEKNSCLLNVHPELRNDKYIIDTMNSLVDHIRANYNMEKII